MKTHKSDNRRFIYRIYICIFLFFFTGLILTGCRGRSPAPDPTTCEAQEETCSSPALPPSSEPALEPAPEVPDTSPENIPAGSPDGYPENLEACSGFFTYYNQGDSRWRDALFGPRDPIRSHGCGPTALAMLISSFTDTELRPDEAAVWAADNGMCVPGEGSSHDIIVKGCEAFGLEASLLPEPEVSSVLKKIDEGSCLVVLVGAGYFSNNGHFLILIKRGDAPDTVRIADPANLKNCYEDWPVSFILDQLKKNSHRQKLIWSVSAPL